MHLKCDYDLLHPVNLQHEWRLKRQQISSYKCIFLRGTVYLYWWLNGREKGGHKSKSKYGAVLFLIHHLQKHCRMKFGEHHSIESRAHVSAEQNQWWLRPGTPENINSHHHAVYTLSQKQVLCYHTSLKSLQCVPCSVMHGKR